MAYAVRKFLLRANMSYQLTFWRYQDESQPHDHQAFYQKLIHDEVDDILDELAPIDKPKIRQSLADNLATLGFIPDEFDRYNFSNGKGQGVEVYLTPYFLLFDCRVLSVKQMNALIDVAFGYDLRLFDPQVNQRFSEV